MSDTFISIRTYYKHTLTIDDIEGEVVKVPVCIRRFNVEQMKQFTIDMRRAKTLRSQQQIHRKPDGDEQEKEPLMMRGVPLVIGGKTIEAPRISDDEIRRRRLAEMTPEARAAFDALEEAEELAIADFYVQTVRDHVWVQPGVTVNYEQEDGTTLVLKTGADLVKAFGGCQPVLESCVRAVNDENIMSADAKKKSRLLSDSTLFSAPSTPRADGVAPDATVDPVVSTASAASAAATDGHGTSPSGSIAMASSTPAPSSRSRRKSTSSSNGSN